jgi:hypothetical protein
MWCLAPTPMHYFMVFVIVVKLKSVIMIEPITKEINSVCSISIKSTIFILNLQWTEL